MNTRSIIPILLLAICPSLLTAEGATGADFEDRLVRFKLDARHQGADLDRIRTDLEQDFGDVRIEPWLDENLLRYSARGFSDVFSLFGPTFDVGSSLRGLERFRSLSRIYLLRYDAPIPIEKAITAISRLESVEYAEPVAYPRPFGIPSDPAVQSNQQWHHQVIGMFAAWDILTADSTSVIAIIDTGIESDHPDLAEAIWLNPGEAGPLADNGFDDDGNGLIDDWWGYDFGGADGLSEDNDPSAVDDDHGTNVAGIAGSVGDNQAGGAGVAYGARLMAVKVGDDAGRSLPGAYDGLLYAAAMGARVINCSWGAAGFSRAEDELVRYVHEDLNALVIAAADNDGADRAAYPAGYSSAMSVAGTRPNDAKTGSSNYHHTVDIAAPGIDIYTTARNKGYSIQSGTSMAAPIVSGAAALVLLRDPSLTADQVEAILQASAVNIDLQNTPYINKLGSGRVDVASALAEMTQLRSAVIVEHAIIDEGGDGTIDRSEKVRLAVTVKNLLAPSNLVRVRLEPDVPLSVTIQEPIVDLTDLQTGELATTPEGTFELTFPEGLRDDARVGLWIIAESPDNTVRQLIELDLYPTWATTELTDFDATFNGDGSVAYVGLDQTRGRGLYFRDRGSLVWHGGFLVGTGPDAVADAVRQGPKSLGIDEDEFALVDPYRLERPDETREIGRSAFSVAGFASLPFDIRLTTVEDVRYPHVLLATYELTNVSSTTVEGAHAGLYIDWDLITTGQFDQASFDEEYRMGFMRNSAHPDLTTGLRLLGDFDVNYIAVDNFGLDRISNELSDEKKWSWLSSGILRESSPRDIDASMLLAAGPISIAPGETVSVPFAFIAGSNHDSLRLAADAAVELYTELTGVGETGLADAGVSVRFDRRSNSIVVESLRPTARDRSVVLHDLNGRVVAAAILPAGRDRIEMETEGLSSGSYLVGIGGTEAGSFTSLLVRIVR